MIQIDTLTMILGGIAILLAFLTPFLSSFWLIPTPPAEAETDTEEENESPTISETVTPLDIKAEQKATPPVSLLMIVQQKQAQALATHLPQFLSQTYAAGFEVIVVAEKGDSDSEDVINRYSNDKRLYATYVPDSSRYMSRRKLAITLGVKAAHNEWIILTDATCEPSSDQWIQAIASHCTEEHNLVVNYANFEDTAPAFYRFSRLQRASFTMREALHGTLYRSIGTSIAFRKSEFLEKDGFRGNLQDTRGEYDFLANKFAQRGKTAVANEALAWMKEDMPSRHMLRSRSIYYMHTRKHLKRSFSHRLLPFCCELALHLTFLTCLAAIIIGIITSRWILLGAGVFSLLATFIIRTIVGRKAIQAYSEDLHPWATYPFELFVVWHNAYHRLRYLHANKADFTSHKV